jgi:hypothetical protein
MKPKDIHAWGHRSQDLNCKRLLPAIDYLDLQEIEITVGSTIEIPFPPNLQRYETLTISLEQIQFVMDQGKCDLCAVFTLSLKRSGETYTAKFCLPHNRYLSSGDFEELDGTYVDLFAIQDVDMISQSMLISSVIREDLDPEI